MNAPSSPLLEELASIKNYLDAASAIVKQGFVPDMAALEKRITDVCLGIQAAERNEQSYCLPELASLLKKLDECEKDMRDWNAARKSAKAP